MLVNANKTPNAEPGISMEALFKQLDFAPHSQAQWDYCKSPVRFNVPCCGRRWGKSIATGHRATYKTFLPESYNWIVGPTYALGEKEFRVVYKDFEKLGLLKYCKKAYSTKQGDMRIETPWKSIIQVVSAEKPDSLLGEGLNHAVMSESAQHPRMIWEQYIEPALSDHLGSADFPSTPKGYNWYHGLHQLGLDPSHKDYMAWSFPTWTNSARYPDGEMNEEILRIKATVSKAYFDQEYGAMFTSFAGAIYEEWDDKIHVRPHVYNPKWPNYLAFDYGFANPFVCLDVQIDPSDNVYVWREYYVRHKATHEHGLHLQARDNPQGYHVDGMWGDPRGANEAASLAMTIGFVGSQDVPWKHSVEQIKRMLKVNPVSGLPMIQVDPSCFNLIRQFNQLHVKEMGRAQKFDLQEMTSDGNIQHKVDDHAADAFRYLIGPLYVLGAGAHLEDVYGEGYEGSESEDFFKLHNNMTLESGIGMGYI